MWSDYKGHFPYNCPVFNVIYMALVKQIVFKIIWNEANHSILIFLSIYAFANKNLKNLM